MKNKLFQTYIVYLFFLLGSFSFSQNVEVLYEAKFIAIPNSENLKDVPTDILKSVNAMSEKLANSVNNQKLSMIASSDSFVLKTEEQMAIDGQNISPAIGRSVLNLYSYVYSDQKDYSYGYDVGKEYIVQFSNSSVSWEITSESKDILGFKCFKAIPDYNDLTEDQERGLPTHVWFTPEINKKGGPWVYFDLPGLILEVENKNARITATEISETDAIVEFPESSKEIISREVDYNQILEQSKVLKRMMER
jgi:GLPGLI family protein